MPFETVSIVDQREAFVMLACREGVNLSELCRRFGISRPTAYKWLERYRAKGREGLEDHSRRPHAHPLQTTPRVEAKVLALRDAAPQWGARKLHEVLLKEGASDVPCVSTVHAILERHGRISPEASKAHTPWKRFAYEEPNGLWQMDYKGHFPMTSGRCHPLTVLDDHSRFALAVKACKNENGPTVKGHLETLFKTYGLPARLLVDNGGAWGNRKQDAHTALSVWIMRYGVAVYHGRPCHPQTQGKIERFHRTLKAEAILGRCFDDLGQAQRAFDDFVHRYNYRRPHEALEMARPGDRYTMSKRSFPSTPPPIEYGPDDTVRAVCDKGQLSFRGKRWRVGKAFRRQPVAIRPTTEDGCHEVYFCATRIAIINLKEPHEANFQCVNHVSEQV